MRVYRLQFLLLVRGVFKRATTGDGLGDAAGEPGGFQFPARRCKDGFGRAKPFDEAVGFARAQTGHGAQSEPVESIGGRQERKYALRGKTLTWKGSTVKSMKAAATPAIPAQMAKLAREVFGSERKAGRWFASTVRALGA